MPPFQDMRERLETLNKIGIALSSETDLSLLLELIVRETRSFTNADAGSLYLVDEDNEVLHFEVAQNDTLRKRADMKPETFKPYSLPLTKDSIAGYVAITGETLNIPDAYSLSPEAGFEFNRDFDKRNKYRTKSMLLVAMKDTEGKIIGVLQLINSLDDDGNVVSFDPSIESLVSSLASQAAVAIKNAQLIKEIKAVFEALIQYSVSAIDARSPFTAGHSKGVAKYTMALARAINETHDGPYGAVFLSPAELEELNYAAWLHDIGKIGVREWVLDKRSRLSESETQALISRFESIKALAIMETQEKKAALAQGGGGSKKEINALDEELRRQLGQIDEDLASIKEINASNYLDDQGLEKLKEIRRKKYMGLDGQRSNYLSDFEFENLSVRKGNLTKGEVEEIQSHVVHTENIVNKIPFKGFLKRVPTFAAGHHEMLDGSGYPKHLQAEDIPLQARIITVADIYEALIAKDRPYKKSMDLAKSLAILEEEATKNRLDKALVKIFIENKVYEAT
ncbi:MAG: GAF domain-containing protein [Deltaproteobacteria bacterium]|nr:MAG: GAF domain-containing protein [Deltaproteobacteria bacterium]